MGNWGLGIIFIVNVLVFLLYGYDKLAAKRFPRNRISENVLIGASLLLAFPGAELARRVFHHKTKDVAFRKRYWTGVVVEAVVVLVVVGAWVISNGLRIR